MPWRNSNEARSERAWPKERIEHLKELIAAGHSNRSAAKILGATPGSVSGKMGRLGMTSNSPGAAKTAYARSQAKVAKDNGAPKGPTNNTQHRPQAKFVALEAEYFRLLEAGVGHDDAAARLKLTATASTKFRGYWHASKGAPSTAGVMPAFAHCDDHVAAVMALGGFPRLSERRGPKGHVAVCLPLMRAA